MRAIRIVGLSAGRNHATALVTRAGRQPNARLVVLDDDAPGSGPGMGAVVTTVPIEGWHRTPTRSRQPIGEQLNWAKPTIEGLEPGTRYRLRVLDEGTGELAEAVITTAPAANCDRFRLASGSCFDVNGQHAEVLEHAYDQLAGPSDRAAPPTYNVWLGDQVYVDAPWLETTTTAKMRSIIFDRYLRTWGISERSSFQQAMRNTSNWFIPDDHEFWNGYPNPSWLTLFGHTARRFARQLYRLPKPGPPHPAAQGKWGSTAGEAYALFASTLDFDEFDEDHSPPALQVIEGERAVVVLVDQRWHRTIRRFGLGAGFMRSEDLDQLLELLASEDRLVCLALSKPMIGHLPHRGVTQKKVEYGPEDYAGQYTALWQAMAERRRTNRPTLCVAGDVHHHAIRAADDAGLLEVVSSPLSMLEALNDDSPISRLRQAWIPVRTGLRTTWRAIKSVARRGEEALRPDLTVDTRNAYPAFAADGTWRPEAGEALYEDPNEASGLATIDLAYRTDGEGRGVHVVTVDYVIGSANDQGDVTTRHEARSFQWAPANTNDPTGRAAWQKL
ncbi:MAG: hypothetical protein AAFO29_01050 [Actinomycetota bacterium]